MTDLSQVASACQMNDGGPEVEETIFLPGVGVWTVRRVRGWLSEFSDDCWNIAFSALYVCPKCHAHWAVLAFDDGLDITPRPAYCERHTARSPWIADRPIPSGSLFQEYSLDLPLLNALPEVLLKREVDLTMKIYI